MDAFFIGIAHMFGYDAMRFYYTLSYVTLFLSLITWFRFPITLFIGFFLMYLSFYMTGFILVLLTVLVCVLILVGWLLDKLGH